ncbi:hypothetical protein CspeluHIS016_0407860 [Cutaneotrichosporon spelunceum]|uniref:Uncharacterized protein n=1 Tax=Cutaneotrichosporon spelunceum TaxID=1672016 RepID=A0AAD3YDH3_9TREE|nr:hypothetical protein CspeluHIS016_0407860 [Cutaneotrichosporon spelunceum]
MSQPPSSSSSSSPPTTFPIGAIIGAAVGGALAVGVLAGLLIVRLKKRTRRPPRDSHLFMDPDFPIALDPYYPVPGQSPAPSNLGRTASTGSMAGLTTRRPGYDAHNVEYVYAGPDGYHDPGSNRQPVHQREPSYQRPQQPSRGFTYAGPGACMPEIERYDYDGHYQQYSEYPAGYPATPQAGYSAHSQYQNSLAQPVRSQAQMTGGYPHAQAGYYDGYAAPSAAAAAYSGSARPPARALSTSTSASPVVATASPLFPQGAQPVSVEMVTHEEDAGAVFPTVLPPMYRAEWAPSEGPAKPAKS